MSPSLILVGAAAEHMETVVTNLCYSDRARDRPVLSLPQAAMFEAMVRGTEGDDSHARWNDVPDAPEPSASPLQESSVGAAYATPPARGITCPRAELPSGASREAGNRIAALERILAPEKDARVDILEREDRRKEAQHLMEMRILRNKLFEQRRRGRAEFQLLQLEREIKVEQLAALRCKQQGCGNHD
ncbi:myb/SANT-like DNA-binding domain-containing protein 3 [Ixodes scapularis]